MSDEVIINELVLRGDNNYK